MRTMTVLIAKQNRHIITEIINVSFNDETANTCTFSLSPNRFQYLCSELKMLGYNIYSLLTW